jgi:ankyrin repeat protein
MNIRRVCLIPALVIVLCLLASVARTATPNTPTSTLSDALVDAIYADDPAAARAALDKGADPNTVSRNGQTPFMLAAGRGSHGQNVTSILGMMLDHGGDIHQAGIAGESPLMAAVREAPPDPDVGGGDGQMKVIAFLLDHGVDLEHKDQQGDTALSLTLYAQSGSYRIARQLINRGANTREPGSSKLTPLHYAAYIDDKDRVRALIKSGSDPNAKDAYGRTPMVLASAVASLDILQILLDAEADVNVKDAWSNTPLMAAIRSQAPDAALLLLQHGADVKVGDQYSTPLRGAFQLTDMPRGLTTATEQQINEVAKKDDELIAAILDKGPDVNVSCGNDTPLTLAIAQDISKADRSMQGKVDARWTRLLLDKGADVNASPPETDPPIFRTVIGLGDAEQLGGYDIVIPTLLLDRGADVNAKDQSKLSVILKALQESDFPLAKLLIERGAKLDCVDEAHKTPLLWAAYYGQADLIKLMLARGADINAHDDLGQGGVQLARKGGRTDVAAMLHKAGATLPTTVNVTRTAQGQPIVHLPLTAKQGAGGSGVLSYAIVTQHESPALLVNRGGRPIAEPVTFGALLTDPALWDPAELNENRYQLRICREQLDACRLFGLVTIKDRTYLGIMWYAPCPSVEHQWVHFVFELSASASTLDMVLRRKSRPTYDQNLTNESKLPTLEKSETGHLIMKDGFGTFRYLPSGTWKQIGAAPKQPD